MGVNEIRDGLDSLLTERLSNVRRVQRREGEAGGTAREFQQLFEFAQRDKNEESAEDKSKPRAESVPLPVSRARTITPEEAEQMKKRNELAPGQLIDIEA